LARERKTKTAGVPGKAALARALQNLADCRKLPTCVKRLAATIELFKNRILATKVSLPAMDSVQDKFLLGVCLDETY
jgi:hypothetical protein